MEQDPIRLRRTVRTIDLSYEKDGVEEEIVVTEEVAVPETEPFGARIGRWCLFLIAGLAPWAFLPFSADAAEAGKLVALLALALIGSVSVFAAGVRARRIVYQWSPMALGALLFFGMSAVSAWFSIAPHASGWGYLSSPDSVIALLLYLLVFHLASVLVRGEDVPRLGAWIAGGIVLATAMNVIQLSGASVFPWAAATLGAGFLPAGTLFGWGILLGALLIGTVMMPMEGATRSRSILRIAGIVVALCGLMILNYPLIWVLVAILMVIVSALRFAERRPFTAPLVAAVAGIVLSLVGPRLPALLSLPIEIRPNAASSFEIVAPALFGPRFLLGSGPATFPYVYEAYRSADLNATPWWNLRFGSAYNALMTVAATGGLLSLLSLLFFAIAALRTSFLRAVDEPVFVPFVGALVFLLASWVFYPAFLAGQVLIFLIAGMLTGFYGEQRAFFIEGPSRGRTVAGFLGASALLVAAFVVAYDLAVVYGAAVYHTRAAAALGAVNGEQALAELDRAAFLDDHADPALRDLSQVLAAKAGSMAAPGSAGAPAADLQATIARAVAAARRATEVNPADALNWANAGDIYERFIPLVSGAGTFAVDSYRKAMERNPRSPEFPVLAARATLASPGADSDAEEAARVLLDAAIALKSDYAPAHFLAAQLLFREDDVSGAVARLEALKATNPFDAGMAFQLGLLYYGEDQLPRARAEFERAVGLYADFANARYFLGLVYDRLGRTSDALVQFRRVAALNPGNAEVAQIIKNLVAGRRALESVVPPASPPESRMEPPVSENPAKAAGQ